MASLIQDSRRSASLRRTSGTDFGSLVGGIAGDELGGDVDQFPEEGLEDAAFDEDALHADAGLTGKAEGGVCGAESRLVEVGPVAVNDEGGVAAEFEEDALAAGVSFELPADFGGAGEADELDAIFFFGEPGGVGVGEGEDGEGFFGPAGLENEFAEGERCEGGLRSGLEDDGAAGGEGGRDLVGYEVEREVERRDGEDGADGETLDESPAIFVAFGEVERDGFAAEADGFFGGGLEGEDGAVDFSAGEADGFAGFGNDELGEALLLLDERGGDVFEDLAAFPAGKGAGAAEAGDGMIDGLAGVGAGGDGDAADEALVPRRADFERFAVVPFFAAEKKAGLRARAHFHGRRLLKFLETMVLGRDGRVGCGDCAEGVVVWVRACEMEEGGQASVSYTGDAATQQRRRTR